MKISRQARELAITLSDYLVSVNAQMPSDKATGKIIPMPVDAMRK